MFDTSLLTEFRSEAAETIMDAELKGLETEPSSLFMIPMSEGRMSLSFTVDEASSAVRLKDILMPFLDMN
jgi:hypothetical protein